MCIIKFIHIVAIGVIARRRLQRFRDGRIGFAIFTVTLGTPRFIELFTGCYISGGRRRNPASQQDGQG
jgi:hypothetical protein